MEKIARPIERELGPVRLYLEDLREVVSVFSEYEPDKLEIIHGDYSYESLDDLEENMGDGVLWGLKLKSYKAKDVPLPLSHDITLSLGWTTKTTAIPDTDMTRSMVSRLEDVLKPRVLYNFDFAKGKSEGPTLLFSLSISAACFLFLVFLSDVSFSSSVVIASILLAGQLGLLAVLKGVSRNSQIILQHSKEQKSFFERKRDTIGVAVVVAVITAILTVFGTLLTQWLSK